MAKRHRRAGSRARAREEIAPPRTYRSRRRTEPRPNRWFEFLRGWITEEYHQRGELPELAEDEVLAWADAYHERTGAWPTWRSGPIPEAPGETWLATEAAMAHGLRGFAVGGTLPRFLNVHRGRYNPSDQKFSVSEVLAWAKPCVMAEAAWPADRHAPAYSSESVGCETFSRFPA